MLIIETCPKCGHVLSEYVITITAGKQERRIKECLNCGFSWERLEDIETKRIPFDPTGWIEHA